MVVKQTQSELYANVRAFYEIIKPAVLWIIPTTSMTQDQTGHARDNGALFDLWMGKNARTGDDVDYSVENLRKCYKALRDTGVLVFSVAPKKSLVDPEPVLSAAVKGLHDHSKPREEYKPDPAKDVAALHRKAALIQAAEQMFGDALREIQTYQGRTHGKTASGRSILKAIFDKGVAGGKENPVIAERTLDAIRDRIRTLYDE